MKFQQKTFPGITYLQSTHLVTMVITVQIPASLGKELHWYCLTGTGKTTWGCSWTTSSHSWRCRVSPSPFMLLNRWGIRNSKLSKPSKLRYMSGFKDGCTGVCIVVVFGPLYYTLLTRVIYVTMSRNDPLIKHNFLNTSSIVWSLQTEPQPLTYYNLNFQLPKLYNF